LLILWIFVVDYYNVWWYIMIVLYGFVGYIAFVLAGVRCNLTKWGPNGNESTICAGQIHAALSWGLRI